MKLLDVNVVVAGYRKDHPDHAVARPWLEATVLGREQFGVPWMVWHSFLRLTTNWRIFRVPTPTDSALAFVEAVRGRPSHVPAEPGPRHRECINEVCQAVDVKGDLVPDAMLAAIAIEHGASVVSFDQDFAKFPLTWIQPT